MPIRCKSQTTFEERLQKTIDWYREHIGEVREIKTILEVCQEVQLPTVAGRIHRELQELDIVIKRTGHIWQKALRSSDDYYVDATALNLHSIYAGIERLLEVIADGIDQTWPTRFFVRQPCNLPDTGETGLPCPIDWYVEHIGGVREIKYD